MMDEEIENNKDRKKIFKLSLTSVLIIIICILLVVAGIIFFVIKDKNEKENSIKAKQNDTLIYKKRNKYKNQKIEFSTYVAETSFVPKTFDKKYTDLYNIVKGSEKEIGGITYSYKNTNLENILKPAIYDDLNNMSLSDKLNLIYNVSDINYNYFSVTKQEIKDIIKKYYGSDDNIYFPEKINIIVGENSFTDLTLNGDIYESNATYGMINSNFENGAQINTTSFSLGLLDKVEDYDDKIVLSEKIIHIEYSGFYSDSFNYTIEDFVNDKTICTVNETKKFDINDYYDNIGCYEYTFKKHQNGYYLSDISFDYNTIDRTELISTLTDTAEKNASKIYLINLDKDILGKDILLSDDCYISLKDNGKFFIYLSWGIGVSGTYEKINKTINCTIDTAVCEHLPDQKTSGKISFKIIDDSTIEVTNASESFKTKGGEYDEETGEYILSGEDGTLLLYPFIKGAKFTLINNI